MDANDKGPRHGIKRNVFRSRGFLVFIVLACCWSLVEDVRHTSARFHVPRHLIMNYEVFGSVGTIFDIFSYASIGLLLIALLRPSPGRLEALLSLAWIGPIVINPLRTVIPGFTSQIWWGGIDDDVRGFLGFIALLCRNREELQGRADLSEITNAPKPMNRPPLQP